MKTNSLPDFIQIYTERVDTTTRVGDSLKKSVNKDKLVQKNPMFKDSLSVGSTLLKSDSIVSDSSLFVKDSLAIADSSRQAFIQHAPKYGGKEISRYQNIGLGNDWLVGIILFSLFLLASAKFLFGKYLSKLVESVFNSHTANNLFLEKNINMVKGSMIVNLLFVVNISLFAVNVLKYVSSGTGLDSGFKEFALIFLAVFLLYVGKSIVIRSLGYIFKGKNECKEYLFTVFLYNKNLGLFLFPVIIALPFVQSHAVQWLVNIGFFMIFFFFVLRIARGLKILLRKHVSIFYMILYLCALEILPLLMIYKLLVG